MKQVIVFLVLFASLSFAADIYITQNTSGSDTGANCANAHSASWFNTAANWGSGGSQISPGSTVHLCGTITTALVVQASGSAVSQTTILFESGAKISLPFCTSGCLNLGSFNYITVNGGTNGIIENTANGSSLANQQVSYAVYSTQAHDIEVKNVTANNIYLHSGTDNSVGAEQSYAIYMNNSHNNIKVHDNIVVDAHTGVALWSDTTGTWGNWEIYHNTLSQNVWGVDVAAGFANGQIDGASIHDNTIFDNSHWWQADNNWHIDPIFVRAPASTSFYRNVYVYNNYIYGAMAHITGFIFLSQYSNGPTYVFNNVIHPTSSSGDAFNWTAQGYIAMQWNGTNNYFIYNNTFDGRTSFGIGNGTSDTRASSGPIAVSSVDWKNNIQLNVDGFWASSFGQITSDFNDWYNIGLASGQFAVGAPTFYTFAQWQSNGKDVNSRTNLPPINSDYTLSSSYSGTNLFTVCNGQSIPGLGALCFDKVGNARPSSGAWDIGAYTFVTSTVSPPTGLTAVPK